MEKEQQHQDSLATVAVKDYAPSESGFSCEPPPAYQKPMRSTAVQVARIAAVTLVLMSVILGSFILAAAWLQSARSCELQLQLQEDFSRQQEEQPSYQALVSDPLQPEESMPHKKLVAADQRLDAEPQQQEAEARDHQQQEQGQDQDQEQDEPSDEQPSEEDGADREQQLHFKLPLTLDFDDLAGSLVERNLRARMDCVVEKRRLDQTVAQPARELRLPFGLNVSTAPRLEHSTGERLAISCETGRDQRHMPAMEVMGPVVVPLPGPVQLPLQFHGAHMQPPQQPQPQQRPRPHPHPQPQSEEQSVPLHILEALRIPIQVAELQQGPPEMQRIPIQITEVHEIPDMRQAPGRIPPQVVAEMRAAVQLAAAEAAAAAARRSPQPHPHPQRPMPVPEVQLRAHLEAQAQAQQAQQAQARRMPPQLQLAEAQQIPMHMFEAHQIPVQVAEGQVFEAHHVPMQMAEEAEARSAQEAGGVPLEAMQMPYQRLVPPPPQPQQQQGPARPHYVHPRSVRSVDEVFHKRDKRVRRCACDCAC